MTTSVRFLNWLLPLTGGISVVGIGALTLTLLIGFEEPNTRLLWFSAVCMFVAPAAVVLHFLMRTDLTASHRTRWNTAFLSRNAPWAFDTYLRTNGKGAPLTGPRPHHRQGRTGPLP